MITLINFPILTTFFTTAILMYFFNVHKKSSYKLSFVGIITQSLLLAVVTLLKVSLVYGLLRVQEMIIPWEKETMIYLFSSLLVWGISVMVFWGIQRGIGKIMRASWASRGMAMIHVAMIHGAVWTLGILVSLREVSLVQSLSMTAVGIPGILFSFILIGPVRQQLALEETWSFLGERGLLVISLFLMAMALVFFDQLLSFRLIKMLP